MVPTAVGDARRIDPQLIDAVNRVGVNVNQLAASVHMDRSFVKYWEAIGREVEELLERLTAHDEAGDDL